MKKLFTLFIGLFLFGIVNPVFAQNQTEYGFDLSLSDFEVEYDRHPSPWEGDIISLKVTVTNNSATAQSWKSIQFRHGDRNISSHSLYPELPVGESLIIEKTWAATFGEGEFTVVSPDDDNMDDNLLVHPGGPVSILRKYSNELVLSDLAIVSGNEKFVFRRDDEIDFSITITNKGRDPQVEVPISFMIDENVFSSITLPVIEPEESETITSTWTAEIGMLDFNVIIPNDENNENNKAERSVTVFEQGVIAESFEGEVFPPSGWISEGSWMKTTVASLAYHGESYAGIWTQNKKLITPKLDIQEGDSLCFAFNINSIHQVQLSTSTNLIDWEQVDDIQGLNDWAEYHIKFNSEENETLMGERYFAFEMITQYGGGTFDLIYGPKLVDVQDDFELTLVEIDGFFQAGHENSFLVHVKNVGTLESEKNITITLDDEIIAIGTTGTMQPEEEKTIALEWIPEQAIASGVFEFAIEADDAEGNNFYTLTVPVYPEDPIKLPLYESFEKSTSLSDYDYWNMQNKGITWKISSGSSIYGPSATPYDGSNVLGFNAGVEGSTELATPLFSMPHEKYTISFQLFRDDNTWYVDKLDRVNIYFNTTPTIDDATLLGTVHRSIEQTPVVEAPGWYFYTYEMDASEVTQGFFILEGIADPSYQHIWIDDLSIEGRSGYDLTITDIYPKNNSLVWGNEHAIKTVTATIKNAGWLPMQNATIKWSINGEEQDDVDWIGVLEPLESQEVVLSEYLFEKELNHTIKAEVTSTLDLVDENNEMEIEISSMQAIVPPYLNSFEEENSLEYWLNIDNDGDSNFWIVSEELPQEGLVSMISYSFEDETAESLTPDNWLISPGVFIEYNKASLSYYIGSGDEMYYEETYEVLISETDPELDQFTSIHKETLESNAYKLVELDLDGYKGKTIFIAFRHFESSDNYYITLDNITINPPEIFTVSLNSNPSDAGTLLGSGEYASGEEVTVMAEANPGYTFKNWTDNGVIVSDNAQYSFIIEGNTNLLANFKSVFTITVSANPEEGGVVSGEGNYEEGEEVQLTATANEGFQFINWSENGTELSTDAQFTLTVDKDYDLTANFKPLYTVTLSANPTNGGSVTGGGEYVEGTTINIEAIANDGYQFINWTENDVEISANAQFTFTVENNRTLTANFKPLYNVTLSANPTDGGSVTGGGEYLEGTTVNIEASANEGYEFINWTSQGEVISSNPNYSFTITNDIQFIANFEKITFTIEATVIEGEGSITPSGTITVEYGSSQTFEITANPKWEIFKVVVDGIDKGVVDTYTFENITSSHTIEVSFSEVVGIEPNLISNIRVYPNPFTSSITITGINSAKAIILTDITGRSIYSQTLETNSVEHQIDLPNISRGVYTLTIIFDNNLKVNHKIVKK